MTYFVGLDWASREHAVCVMDRRHRSWLTSRFLTPKPGFASS